MVFCECVNTVQRSRRSARGSLAQGAAVAAAPERRRWRHKEKLQIDGGRKPLHERASTSACLYSPVRGVAPLRRPGNEDAQPPRARRHLGESAFHHCRRSLANCDRHLHEGTLSAHLPQALGQCRFACIREERCIIDSTFALVQIYSSTRTYVSVASFRARPSKHRNPVLFRAQRPYAFLQGADVQTPEDRRSADQRRTHPSPFGIPTNGAPDLESLFGPRSPRQCQPRCRWSWLLRSIRSRII